MKNKKRPKEAIIRFQKQTYLTYSPHVSIWEMQKHTTFRSDRPEKIV